jgi:hypothetical protein
MAKQDFASEEKAKIALEALFGELSGATSKDIGSRYGISAQQVTRWKNQGLEGFRSSFQEEKAKEEHSLDLDELSKKVDSLLGSSAFEAFHAEEGEVPDIDEVIEAIFEWNDKAKADQPKIYVSEGLVKKISGHSLTEVRTIFESMQKGIDAHNKKHGLDANTNKRLRGFDYRDALGF